MSNISSKKQALAKTGHFFISYSLNTEMTHEFYSILAIVQKDKASTRFDLFQPDLDGGLPFAA